MGFVTEMALDCSEILFNVLTEKSDAFPQMNSRHPIRQFVYIIKLCRPTCVDTVACTYILHFHIRSTS